jgi:hypothetical protein
MTLIEQIQSEIESLPQEDFQQLARKNYDLLKRRFVQDDSHLLFFEIMI